MSIFTQKYRHYYWMLPAPVISLIQWTRALPYRGTGRKCPVCEKSSRVFLDSGMPRRKEAKCPHCWSLERHRLLWLFLKDKTNLFDGTAKSVLHVAPERCFEPRLRSLLGNEYLTADFLDPRAMVKMDITDIQYPDESFDVIICNHVLEHVNDDLKAMSEFHRVLKPSGWAILLVPISSEKTFEDPSVTDPRERLRLFGQEDHVRRYGPDYVDRLRSVGFQVQSFKASDLVNTELMHQFQISDEIGSTGEVYYCTK
jgi:SAM-dependent methyltransferase